MALWKETLVENISTAECGRSLAGLAWRMTYMKLSATASHNRETARKEITETAFLLTREAIRIYLHRRSRLLTKVLKSLHRSEHRHVFETSKTYVGSRNMASAVTTILIYRRVQNLEIPFNTLADNGSQFKSAVFQMIFVELVVRSFMNTEYHT